MRTKINHREWTEPETQGQTFREYATSWLLEKAHRLRPKTAKRYATLLDNHLFPYLGGYAMIEITPAEIRTWRVKLSNEFKRRIKAGNVPNKKTTGEATIADAYNLCHAIMQTAKRERVIYYNPCIIEGAGSVTTQERKPATLEELDIIANNMPERYRALVYFAAWSGLRFSEIAGLTRADVVLIRNGEGKHCYRVNVDKQTYKIGGTLYKDAAPKTDAGRRVIMLPPHVTDVMTAHLAEFTPESNSAYVFCTRNLTAITESNINKMFRYARSKAKREDLRFHDLRHTCATFAAQTHATTKELMRFMGHSNPRAAMIYQHATDNGVMQVAANMSHLYNGEPLSKTEVRDTLHVIEGHKGHAGMTRTLGERIVYSRYNRKPLPEAWLEPVAAFLDYRMQNGRGETSARSDYARLRKFAANTEATPCDVSKQCVTDAVKATKAEGTRKLLRLTLAEFFAWMKKTGQRKDNPARSLKPTPLTQRKGFAPSQDTALEAWYGPVYGFTDSKADSCSNDTLTTVRGRLWALAHRSESGPLTITETELIDSLNAVSSPVTRKGTRQSYRQFFAWLQETGQREDNPAENLPAVSVYHALKENRTRKRKDGHSYKRQYGVLSSEWLEGLEGFTDYKATSCSEATAHIYARQLASLARVVKVAPQQVATVHVARALAQCQSHKTYNNRRSCYVQFFAWLQETGQREDNPTEGLPQFRLYRGHMRAEIDAQHTETRLAA